LVVGGFGSQTNGYTSSFVLYHNVLQRSGMNHPMGPLALADFIGLDTVLAILKIMYKGYGDPKYRPCPLLRQYVEAGWLGKKSGRGFYKY
jgi:3-hydroxybutyryl-CoA dehydrogenase